MLHFQGYRTVSCPTGLCEYGQQREHGNGAQKDRENSQSNAPGETGTCQKQAEATKEESANEKNAGKTLLFPVRLPVLDFRPVFYHKKLPEAFRLELVMSLPWES